MRERICYFWHCNRVACIGKTYYGWIRREESATHGHNSNRIDAKSLTVLDSYKMMAANFKEYDMEIYQIAVKKYLGTIRRKMTVAYVQNATEKLELLLNRFRSERKRFPIRGVRNYLFKIKIRIYFTLIQMQVHSCWIDILDNI